MIGATWALVLLVVLACGGPYCYLFPWVQADSVRESDATEREFNVTPKYGVFFGNSFSATVSVHTLVKEFAVAAGYEEPVFVADYMGGQDLAYHLTQVQSYPANNVTSTSLPEGETWDVVVMQGYSTEFDDGPFSADMVALYAAFRDHASGNGAGVVGIPFQTWAYQYPEYTPYPSPYTSDYNMQDAITSAYAAAAMAIEASPTSGQAIVAPVGEAYRESSFDDDLYSLTDFYHPGRLSPPLAAMVIFRAIYNDTTSDVSYSAADVAGFITFYHPSQGSITLTTQEYADLQTWADAVEVVGAEPEPDPDPDPIGVQALRLHYGILATPRKLPWGFGR